MTASSDNAIPGETFLSTAFKQSDAFIVKWHDPPAEDFLKEPILSHKMVIYGAEIHIRRVRNGSDRNRFWTILSKQLFCCVQNVLSGFFPDKGCIVSALAQQLIPWRMMR
jgi:hypothetical protein